MVTAVTELAPSAIPQTLQHAASGGPQLSELAQNALQGFGRMQAEFDAGSRAVTGQLQPQPAVPAATDGAALTQQVEASREAFAAALKVQSQILQFSMATSISSTLGNNLNSFLKGA